MRTEYHKLVRDRIPEIIRQEGRECATRLLSPDEYRQALLVKLVEEAQEAAHADSDSLVTELADVLEVIDAIIMAHNLDREQVVAEQTNRRTERGGFANRVQLLWTE